MKNQSLLDKAVAWLSRHADRDGRITVSLGRRTSSRTNRYVMLLLVAGFVQPIAMTRKDISRDQIVYGVTDRIEEGHADRDEQGTLSQNS